MIRIFKNYSPFAVLSLMLLCVIMKLGFLGTNTDGLVQDGQYLWSVLVAGIQNSIGLSSYFLVVLTVLMTFGQALYLNAVVTKYDLFPSMSYLPAMTYVIITSLLPEWNQMNLYLVLNWFIIAIFDKVVKLYLTADSRKDLINIGLLTSVVVLFSPALAVLILAVILCVLFLRPFRIADYVAFIIGLLTPLYFLVAYWYVVDRLYHVSHIFVFRFEWVKSLDNVAVVSVALGSLLLALVLGFGYLSNYLNRIVVQTKKYWSVVLVFFLMLILASLVNFETNFASLLIALPFVTLVITPIWYEDRKKWLTIIYAALLLLPLLYVQYIH